jgi:hypothetical protein
MCIFSHVIVMATCEDFDAEVATNPKCADEDPTGSKTAVWCGQKESSTDSATRMKTMKSICSRSRLKSHYDTSATTYCNDYPEDNWCKCYNVVNHGTVCSSNSDAAGCREAKNVDDNQEFFKDGYDILKTKHHCRPRVCTRPDINYVPPGAIDTCQTSYNMCGQDIDIRNTSNSQIVLKCNEGMSERELPDWWYEDDGDDWWLDDGRKPPFDKFPLNKLPITEFPDEFDWEDDNVKYLTYGGVGFISLCCCCMLILMMSMGRRR